MKLDKNDRAQAHEHGRAAGRRSLTIALAITFVFLIVKFAGAWLTNSLTLLADSGTC